MEQLIRSLSPRKRLARLSAALVVALCLPSRWSGAGDTAGTEERIRRLEEALASARESEAGVEMVLEQLLRVGGPWTAAAVEEALHRSDQALSVTEVVVAPVNLAQYDALLEGKEAEDGERAGVPLWGNQ